MLRIDCRRAHWLLSKCCDARLGLREHVRLRLHLLVCDSCAVVSRNLALLARAVRQLGR